MEHLFYAMHAEKAKRKKDFVLCAVESLLNKLLCMQILGQGSGGCGMRKEALYVLRMRYEYVCVCVYLFSRLNLSYLAGNNERKSTLKFLIENSRNPFLRRRSLDTWLIWVSASSISHYADKLKRQPCIHQICSKLLMFNLRCTIYVYI